VDVILSKRDRDAGADAGETILSDVRVLAIDQTVEEKNGQKVVVGKTATLELAPRQAEVLAQARQMGTLQLALRSLADSDPSKRGKPEDDSADRSIGRIKMIRFGVSTSTTPK
jgi:pilus assembly protein CpaB